MNSSISDLENIIFALESLELNLESCNETNKFEKFNLKNKPNINLVDFFLRIRKFTNCDLNTIIYALILIERIKQKNQDLNITNLNLHTLFLVTIYIASKLLEDCILIDTEYSFVFGILIDQLCLLENEFLNKIKFDLHVTEEYFTKLKKNLANYKI